MRHLVLHHAVKELNFGLLFDFLVLNKLNQVLTSQLVGVVGSVELDRWYVLLIVSVQRIVREVSEDATSSLEIGISHASHLNRRLLEGQSGPIDSVKDGGFVLLRNYISLLVIHFNV